MRRGDIYLVSLDPTAGHEQSGSRPVLVVSPAEFNEATKLPVILPITNGGEFARRLGFAVPVTGIKHRRRSLRSTTRNRSGSPPRPQGGYPARAHHGRSAGESRHALRVAKA